MWLIFFQPITAHMCFFKSKYTHKVRKRKDEPNLLTTYTEKSPYCKNQDDSENKCKYILWCSTDWHPMY